MSQQKAKLNRPITTPDNRDIRARTDQSRLSLTVPLRPRDEHLQDQPYPLPPGETSLPHSTFPADLMDAQRAFLATEAWCEEIANALTANVRRG
jgi:hypothetical protein